MAFTKWTPGPKRKCTRHQSRCWYCPGYTFNAGRVCKVCLDAGREPVPEHMRDRPNPTVAEERRYG